MRVGIVLIYHESNTFIRTGVGLEDFRQDLLLTGGAIRNAFADSHHEIGGFFAGLDEAGLEAVGLLAARIIPGGEVTAATCDALTGMMLAEVDRAGPLDGFLVAPHGACVAESAPDMDGHWLSALRERVGAAVPIISTLDPHANLSPRMVAACDAIIAYRSNPHLDQKQRGLDAARLMARTLRGEVRPTAAASFPPIAINIERQSTADPPCRPLYERADEMLNRPGVLSNSIILGFPYADVEEMGSSFVVVTDSNHDLAQRYADELAGHLWEQREAFVARLTDVEAVLDLTARDAGPVCLLDMGDNIGGGSPGDGTAIAHAVMRRGGGRCFVCLMDPESVEQARRKGIGQRARLVMGGKTDDLHGPPLEAEVTVRSLHDGRFEEPEVRHSALTQYDMGSTAVVETDDGLTIMLTSRPIMPFSLRQLTSCGLDPHAFKWIVAKGVHAPAAAYAPVCTRLIRVNTPGVTTADMETLPFKSRRKPLFPFERDFDWSP